jgi:N-acyl amino acid synthase of PEP-CTERM/exosortase system
LPQSYERFTAKQIETGVSSGELQELFSLRYEIYCLEEHFLPSNDYPDHCEHDNYDSLSVHFAVRENNLGMLAGCVRLVQYSTGLGFPTAGHFTSLYQELSGLPLDKIFEVSRLCVAPFFRKRMTPKDGLYGIESYEAHDNVTPNHPNGFSEQRKFPIILVLLLKEMYRWTVQNEGRFWIASMEPGLMRYLSGFGLESTRLMKDCIDFYGRVVPCLIEIDSSLARMAEKKPELYEFFMHDREIE